MISLIAAMGHNRVIGSAGQMPWHLPAELAYFKKITLHKTILMGKRTFTSLSKALPKRRNLVLTTQADFFAPNCEIFTSLAAALAALPVGEESFIIGGGELYRQTLPLAARLYLTFIDCESPGDTFFPQWDPAEWQEIHSSDYPADGANIFSFRTVQLERKSDDHLLYGKPLIHGPRHNPYLKPRTED